MEGRSMESAAQDIRPGRMWYGVAAIVLGAGVAVFVVLLIGFINGIAGMPRSMIRVVAPGSFDVTLDKAGAYTIFDEYQSVMGGRVYSHSGGLSGLTCTLTEKATGRSIPLTAPTGSETYSMGPYAGRSLFAFNIATPGDYTLSAEYGGAGGPDAVLAIGHGFMGNLMRLMAELFAGVGTLIVSVLLAVVIFIITIVRRNVAMKRLRGAGGG
jgi:hypothetical protein